MTESSHLEPASASAVVTGGSPPRLLDAVRARVRWLGLAICTEEAYVGWVRRFVLANGKRRPRDMGAREVERLLTGLATHDRVLASTQNQALSALLLLYREVLAQDLPWMDDIRRAKRPARLHKWLTPKDLAWPLVRMTGVTRLFARYLYPVRAWSQNVTNIKARSATSELLSHWHLLAMSRSCTGDLAARPVR